MNYNSFDQKLTIENNTPTRSTSGAIVDSWATVCVLWGKWVMISGSEKYLADQLVSVTVKKVKCRYNSAVKQAMRLKTRTGEYYNIRDIEELGRKDGMMLTLETYDNNLEA